MPITMHTRHHGPLVTTDVWDGSTLYVFRGSIKKAARCGTLLATAQILARSPEVADMPARAASLVWMEGTPYLFPGSLMDASKWGKNSKSAQRQRQRERRKLILDELAGFDKQYGLGIGEKITGKERTCM